MFVAKVANLVSVFLHQTLNLRLEASDGELLHLRRLLLLPLGAGFFPLGALALELRRERHAQLFLVRRARSVGARQTLRQLRHLLGQSLLISKKPIGEVEVPLGRRVVRRALFRELRRRVRGRAIVRHAKFRLEFRHRRVPTRQVGFERFHPSANTLVHPRRRRERAGGGTDVTGRFPGSVRVRRVHERQTLQRAKGRFRLGRAKRRVR